MEKKQVEPQEQLPVEQGSRKPRRRRSQHADRRRHSIWLYIFAFIGAAFVAVEFFRYLIVPFLVQLHIWTGGKL